MKKRLNKIIIALCIYLVAIIISFNKLDNLWIIGNILFVISYIIVGFDILKKAFKNIKKGEIFDENFLMSVATLGAFFVGEFPEAVAVMLFYQIGELFQNYAVDKSRKSISSLMDIRPEYANLVTSHGYKKVNPKSVNVGDYIIVKPGEKVPLDGTVIEGNSMLDTSSLTGESVPTAVIIGDSILSGTINLKSTLKIEVTKIFSKSMVSKILDLVENASSRKSNQENFITEFARIYTPIVVAIALIIAIFLPIILKCDFSIWIYRALSFLVISCPCALVLSIPLSFFGGIGRASKDGILVKGSNYLERIAATNVVVFDKTGTVTKGVFEVERIVPVNTSNDLLLESVAYCEFYSNHPIAESIKKKYGKDIDSSLIKDNEEISGNGIRATINDDKLIVGNSKLLKENNILFDEVRDTGTIIYVAKNGEYNGYILISDKIKDDSKEAIMLLKKNGIDKLVMLTGDKNEVGLDVASKLGINDVYTELLPTDKVSKVKELLSNKKEKDKLIFIGDGINDAPVLALSDVGIAMGLVGADAAIEAADIVIMDDKPSKLIHLIKIARKTIRIAKENTYFAISVKILVLIFSALGLTSMWMAVFADVGVTILAVLNSFRVLYGKIE